MTTLISTHSFRRGAGKSSIVANIGALMALAGQRVGIVDANFSAPAIHSLFGLAESQITCCITDFLLGRCAIVEAAYDLTTRLGPAAVGQICIVPANAPAHDVEAMLREGYDVERLSSGLHDLIDEFDLDVLLIDNPAGLNEETLPPIAIADTVLIVFRPDQLDYQGTSVFVEIARQLDASRIMLLVNEVPKVFDHQDVRNQVRRAYDSEVVGVLPHNDELAMLGGKQLFVLLNPEHDITDALREAAALLAWEGV